MVSQKLIRKASMLQLIPAMQNVVENVLGILDNADSSVIDLSKAIKHDLFLTSKILGIANSAYYNRGEKIYSLDQAINHIGFRETKSIIVCVLFSESIKKSINLRHEDMLTFWKHSIFVACASRVLAEKTLTVNPQKTYLAALLHDIGKCVFYSEIKDYDAIVLEGNRNNNSLDVIEKNEFGVDHQETGYIIAIKWKLPEAISYVIKHHHKRPYDNEFRHLITIIQTANDFFFNIDHHTNQESLILLQEKTNIEKEIKINMEALNIN